MSTKNLEIERLRAVAVIMTTVAHGIFSSFLPTYMLYSYTGVDMFFVISGFVVTLSFIKLLPEFIKDEDLDSRLKKAQVALKTFYLRRVFRILPLALFWLAMYMYLSLYFAKAGGGGNFGPPEDIFREVVAVLSGFHNYLVSYGLTGNISHFWSLAVEEQFYAVLPLFLILFVTKKTRLKYIAIILGVILIVVPFIRDAFGLIFFKHIYAQRYFSLLFGVVLALFFKKRDTFANPKDGFIFKHLSLKLTQIATIAEVVESRVWCVVKSLILDNILLFIQSVPKVATSITLLAVIWILPGIPQDGNGNHMHVFGYVVIGLSASVLVFLASKEEGWILNIPILKNILEYVGGRSYCIYLAHFAFVRLRPTLLSLYYGQIPRWVETTPKGVFLQNTLMWIGLLVVSELCYRLLEKPMMNIGKVYIKESLSKK